MLEDGVETVTSKEQKDVESEVASYYAKLWKYIAQHPGNLTALALNKSAHAKYLRGALGKLPGGFCSLDPSRPWIAFWATHGLNLLEAPHNRDVPPDALTRFLSSCQQPTGGFGGGPYQIAHLAPTYAATAALVSLGSEAALQCIDRPSLWAFLLRMCVPPARGGGLTVHEGGEVDIRSCYLAIATAHMLSLDAAQLAERSGCVDYIRRCQSYEGGLGGEPGNEAHGGYTYCGLAALMLLGRESELDLDRLTAWAVQRQSAMEGGFNGRTNKLVDGCYSFWQGGLFSLLSSLPHELLTPRPRKEDWASEPAAAAGTSAVTTAVQCDLDVPDLPDALREARTAVECAQDACAQAQAAVDACAARRDAAESSGDANAASLHALFLEDMQDGLASCQAHLEHVHISAGVAAAPNQEGVSTLHALSSLLPEAARTARDLSESNERPNSSARAAGLAQGGEAVQLYDALALQLWVLVACQSELGLRDKPGKSPDFYHTCYCLSGLSTSQHLAQRTLGAASNVLAAADPRLNVTYDSLRVAYEFFGSRPLA